MECVFVFLVFLHAGPAFIQFCRINVVVDGVVGQPCGGMSHFWLIDYVLNVIVISVDEHSALGEVW